MSLGSLRRRVEQAVDFKEEASKAFGRAVRLQLTRGQLEAAFEFGRIDEALQAKAVEQLPATDKADKWDEWMTHGRQVFKDDPLPLPRQFQAPPEEDEGLWEALEEHTRGSDSAAQMAASVWLWWLALGRAIRQTENNRGRCAG